ncbi:hypothetical protein EC396_03415 [Lutibacter sp. HS1-25]|uniref:hypothetical protein n=1 Tax=Lutibacter sp. HS1-25 TaxID=2485000 RepID=UPI001011BDF0|nr:hypothetical protein [Lutibacter sp. HS1-25]RXP61868.1 hypothetical protein EC396_03415 [Lutibacter sp. HS1-25]
MKKTIQLLSIFILVFSFSSCEEIKDATNIDIDTVQKQTINAQVSAGTNLPFNQTATINIDNDDTHDYLKLIKKVTINSFTYKIINFSGDANGSIDVDFKADGVTLASHSVVVKTTADNQVVFDIADTTTLNSIASKLKNGSTVVLSMVGTSTSDSAMSFKVEITVDLTVTAGVL